MTIIQLKASDSFIRMVSEVRKMRSIVLCEGSRDVEAFKVIANKLSLVKELEGIAVTDAEGINTLRRELLPTLLALIMGKVVSKPKPVVSVVDADRLKPGERVRGLEVSLDSRGYEVLKVERVCSNVWALRIRRGGEEIPLLIAVNGLFDEPFTSFETHEFEDHIVYLKLLENRLTEEDIRRARRAAELVIEGDYALLNNVGQEYLEKAFKHYVCLLKALVSLIRT